MLARGVEVELLEGVRCVRNRKRAIHRNLHVRERHGVNERILISDDIRVNDLPLPWCPGSQILRLTWGFGV